MDIKTERTKRIFISDIHMGDTESITTTETMKAWGWLGINRAELLSKFLKNLLSDKKVKQVVILGDLFDQWVCPTTISPVPEADYEYNQFKKIANAPHNICIIDALKSIASSEYIELIYVPGNHDMLITKEILEDIIPGINYIGVSEGVGTFSEDGIIAEHGNNYCFFNAPDSYDNKGHILPLGYFITRAISEKVAQTGEDVNILEVLENAVKNIMHHDKFAKLAFETIVDFSGLDTNSEITMDGIDNYQGITCVKDIEVIFGNLYDEWEKNMKPNVHKELAVIDDIGFLFPAAITQFFMKRKASIVVFGHTHKYELRGILNSKKKDEESSSRLIYANSGSWIDSVKKCTFVETEIDSEQKKRFVRIKHYDEKGDISMLEERYINIKKRFLLEDLTDLMTEELHSEFDNILTNFNDKDKVKDSIMTKVLES